MILTAGCNYRFIRGCRRRISGSCPPMRMATALDFQIPPETPAGIVTFTVSVSEASIKTVKKKFVFQVRR